MVFKDRYSRAAAMLLGLAPRNGCPSLMQGQQYVFAKTDVPSATLRISYDAGKVCQIASVFTAQKSATSPLKTRALERKHSPHLPQIRYVTPRHSLYPCSTVSPNYSRSLIRT